MSAVESIVAAATRVLTRKGSAKTGGRTAATSLAWDMYEQVPEVGTYADWISNVMSGATLYAGKRGLDGTVEPARQGSRAQQLVSSMAGGMDGQSVMLGDFGTQLAVAGDSWLVIVPNPEADDFASDRWEVLSSEEVTVQRGGTIKAVIDGEEIEIPKYEPGEQLNADTPVAIRIWKSSPRRKAEPTSPVLRSLVVLEELRLLNAAVAAIARSRITGRGILLVPSGAQFPTVPGQAQAGDSLLDTFVEVASTAITNPESAAATVPIVLEIPGDLISGVKWLQFTPEFDAMALQLREEAVRRFAVGADVPAELLQGLGDVNHWGAWALTAEGLKMGAEPRLRLVCNALTEEWLRPILDAEGDPDAAEMMVWYDTAMLRSSSNKGATALEAFKLDLISDVATRRELGFTEADAPAAVPRSRQPEDQQPDTEGNDLPVNETEAPPATDGLTASAVLDSFTGQTTAALAEAVDGLVWAALAVASRKLMQTPACPRPARTAARELAASAAVHTRHPVNSVHDVVAWRLLDGAWTRVPDVAQRYGVDPVTLAAALDSHVTALLISGEQHTFDSVPRLLAQIQWGAAA